jgi:SNF5 / SMARCB1 / INI1
MRFPQNMSIGNILYGCVDVRTDIQMENAALADEVMIPIRLDIDLDSFKIKDAFMWNMNGFVLSHPS